VWSTRSQSFLSFIEHDIYRSVYLFENKEKEGQLTVNRLGWSSITVNDRYTEGSDVYTEGVQGSEGEGSDVFNMDGS
jgi:hypothetical protein